MVDNMNYWIINHSWDSFVKTKEYCGFINKDERDLIHIDANIIYYGQGVIFGLFKVIDLVNNEFNGWKKAYPYQIKISSIMVSERGLVAKQFQERFMLLREDNEYQNLIKLTENEFNLIKRSLENKDKTLILK